MNLEAVNTYEGDRCNFSGFLLSYLPKISLSGQRCQADILLSHGNISERVHGHISDKEYITVKVWILFFSSSLQNDSLLRRGSNVRYITSLCKVSLGASRMIDHAISALVGNPVPALTLLSGSSPSLEPLQRIERGKTTLWCSTIFVTVTAIKGLPNRLPPGVPFWNVVG